MEVRDLFSDLTRTCIDGLRLMESGDLGERVCGRQAVVAGELITTGTRPGICVVLRE